jgi:hypothetical protein
VIALCLLSLTITLPRRPLLIAPAPSSSIDTPFRLRRNIGSAW